MATPIVKEAGPTGARQQIPASVARLDALLNLRIVRASGEALDRELRRKSAFKRLLVELPAEDLEPAARLALAHLTEVR